MTNAEKYRLTGIEAYNLSQELGEYLTVEKKAEGVFVSDINSFFVRATKPTLTEDEKIILRKLNKEATVTRYDNKLYFHCEGNLFEDDVFRFIKERRRV